MQQEYVDGTYSGNSNITIDWKYYIGPMTSTSHERGTLGSYTNTQSYKLFNVFETNGKRYVYLNYNPFESSGSPIQSANNADNDVEAMRILVALLYWGAGDINSSNALKF